MKNLKSSWPFYKEIILLWKISIWKMPKKLNKHSKQRNHSVSTECVSAHVRSEKQAGQQCMTRLHLEETSERGEWCCLLWHSCCETPIKTQSRTSYTPSSLSMKHIGHDEGLWQAGVTFVFWWRKLQLYFIWPTIGLMLVHITYHRSSTRTKLAWPQLRTGLKISLRKLRRMLACCMLATGRECILWAALCINICDVCHFQHIVSADLMWWDADLSWIEGKICASSRSAAASSFSSSV